MLDIHAFVIVDAKYSEASLVSLSSFKKFNSDIPVHVYCMNFTQQQFIKYINIAIDDFHLTDYYFKQYDFEMFDTSEHSWNIFYNPVFKLIAAKFKVMSEQVNEYFLYFDIDTVFMDSIKSIKEYIDDDFIYGGVRWNTSYPECNCGLILMKNNHLDYFRLFHTFCLKNYKKYLNLDEIFLEDLYHKHITYFDIKFNTKSDMHLDNPIMIHYVGSKKPFEIKEQDSPVAVFNTCQYYRWYEYYDTVKQYFSDKFNSQVANVRQKINSKEFKIFDQFSIQGKLYGIYRDKALPVITSYYVKKYSS